jgi:hypothetical protein
MAQGDVFDGTTTIGDLRAELVAKGYTAYAPVGAIDLQAYMHPLRSRGVVLMGADSDPCLVYQKRMVDNATRRF